MNHLLDMKNKIIWLLTLFLFILACNIFAGIYEYIFDMTPFETERKRMTKEEQEKQFNNYKAKILHDLYAKNMIGDIKCLPV